jgi:hypothetical protein
MNVASVSPGTPTVQKSDYTSNLILWELIWICAIRFLSVAETIRGKRKSTASFTVIHGRELARLHQKSGAAHCTQKLVFILAQSVPAVPEPIASHLGLSGERPG